MKRHWPLASLIETDEKARVAVLSRGLASAAEEGWRTPPARETGTGVVGFASASDCAAAAVVAATDDEDSIALVVATTSAVDAEDGDDGALVVSIASGVLEEEAPRVTVTNVIPQSEFTVEDAAGAKTGAAEVAATSIEVAEAEVEAGAAEEAGAAPEDPPPNVKVWLVSPEAHAA